MKVVEAEQTAVAVAADPHNTPDALEAVRLFSLHGSLARVAADLHCSLYELKKLSRTDWWAREYAEIQRAEAAQLNVTLTKILDTTLEKLEDRVTEGDFLFAGGKLQRVPLSASTLARVVEIVFDKRQLVRQLPTAIVESGENSKLEQLAQKLRALGAKDPDLLGQSIIDIPAAELPQQERTLRSAAEEPAGRSAELFGSEVPA